MITDDEKSRHLATRFCKETIVRLREVLKRNPPKDSPCTTCAFAPRTDDWEGFENTVYGLMQALEKKKPFLCHRNMETVDGEYKLDLEKAIPCGGYEAIRNRPEALQAIIEAACAVKDTD